MENWVNNKWQDLKLLFNYMNGMQQTTFKIVAVVHPD